MARVKIEEREGRARCEIRIPGSDWVAAALFVEVDEKFVLAELRVLPAEHRLPDDAQLEDIKKRDAELRRSNMTAPNIGEWSQTPEGIADPGGLPMGLLRELRLADLWEPISYVAHNLAHTGPQEDRRAPEEFERAWRQMADAPNPGRKPRTDAHFAAWANRISLRTSDPVTSRRPIAAVADDTGMTREQIRDIAHEARSRGFLTRPPAGARGGGVLTQKGRDLLATTSNEEQQ
jgi:hypothetical protein